jgi:hypothetical protein
VVLRIPQRPPMPVYDRWISTTRDGDTVATTASALAFPPPVILPTAFASDRADQDVRGLPWVTRASLSLQRFKLRLRSVDQSLLAER